MDPIDYQEWRQWSEQDIRLYAGMIAKRQGLNSRDSESTARQMVMRADNWRKFLNRANTTLFVFPKKIEANPEYEALLGLEGRDPREVFFSINQSINQCHPPLVPKVFCYPQKCDRLEEALLRSWGRSEEQIYRENQRNNAPDGPETPMPRMTSGELIEKMSEYNTREQGWGLNRQQVTTWKPKKESKQQWDDRKHARKWLSRDPFSLVQLGIKRFIEDAHWLLNCIPLGFGRWLLPREPQGYGDPLYFLDLIERRFQNVQKQIELGNAGGAALHAYQLGMLQKQLELDMAAGGDFEKWEDLKTRLSSRKGHRAVSPQVLRDEFRRLRPSCKNATAAGRQVAEIFGISEGSVRNAFPGSRWPRE